MLVILLKRLGLGVRIGVTVALCVLMVRWLKNSMNHVRIYYVNHIHRTYHAIQMEVLHIHHELQFKVLRAHHGIQVEVLYVHHRWLLINGTLTFGELFVFLGALIVAASIWRHTCATERTAAREHKRHRDITLAYELCFGRLALLSPTPPSLNGSRPLKICFW